MRFLIILGILIGLHATASATCYTSEQCTIDYATGYLGGAPWTSECHLEPASWDPQVQSYTCIAHSQTLDTSGGVGYIEMEYATLASGGTVWPYLPYYMTYWWPSKHDATAWLTGYALIRNADWAYQDARITWTYKYCNQWRQCEGFINYDLDDGSGPRYIHCMWNWYEGQLLPSIVCDVGQGSMR